MNTDLYIFVNGKIRMFAEEPSLNGIYRNICKGYYAPQMRQGLD